MNAERLEAPRLASPAIVPYYESAENRIVTSLPVRRCSNPNRIGDSLLQKGEASKECPGEKPIASLGGLASVVTSPAINALQRAKRGLSTTLRGA
jgi:hypothetical protein